ncbi:MAG: hypothetical protein WA347_03645 [Rhabdochlamydiaceae bacterium]|jgi:hypothetical protein
MHRFKILWSSIGVLILIGLGIYLIASFCPSFFFYNTAYSKYTQLRGYVLTDEQIIQAGNFFLENEQFSPQQLSFATLNKHRKSFIVILAKNTGNKQAFGTLKCTAGRRNIEVSVIGLKPHMKESDVWIIPVGSAILGDGPDQPQVSVEWAKLYAK